MLVQDEQQVLLAGSWLLGLLAMASVAVLVGGRMAEQTRRVGLLKAVGGTPGLVAAVLLAENLVAGAGRGGGRAGRRMAGRPAAHQSRRRPGRHPRRAVAHPAHRRRWWSAVALAVALAATLVPAIRAARTSTVRALADAARPPRRRGRLIAVSARLPVPLLLGLRLAARRPRRALLSAASIAVTVTGIVAVLAFHATVARTLRRLPRAGQPA